MVTTPTPVPWGDVIFKAVVILAVTGGAILDWDTNINVARTDAVVIGHLTNHPDADLTRRLNRMQTRMDRMSQHIREMEQEWRTEQGPD